MDTLMTVATTTVASRQHIVVEDGSRVLARADVQPDTELHTVHAWLHVESGQLPPGVRTRLVDAVLDLPGLQNGAHLQAAVPAGDGEMVTRVRQRCEHVRLRSAGSSCLVEATLPGGPHSS